MSPALDVPFFLSRRHVALAYGELPRLSWVLEIYYSSPMWTFRLLGGIPPMPSTLYVVPRAERAASSPDALCVGAHPTACGARSRPRSGISLAAWRSARHLRRD